MSRTVIFIHGMFLNPKSWQKWGFFFADKGYSCVAPAWPYHEGEPAALRANIHPQLGKLDLKIVTASMREVALRYDEPILIGHSLGGLIVQLLVNEGIGGLGVPICSVAPNKMMAVDWGLLRNTVEITNPLKGDEPFPMDADGFHQNFGNTMPREESDAAFEQFAMHESRNVLRDIMTEDAKVDLERAHVPLLFVAADKDEIIPAKLCEKNARAYEEETGVCDYMEFRNRGHFICGQAGWEEVADYVANWIEQHDAAALGTNRSTDALHAPR